MPESSGSSSTALPKPSQSSSSESSEPAVQSEAAPTSNVEPLTDKDVKDLRAVWSVLVDRMSANPAMAVLLQSITLVKLDGPKAHIAPLAGQETTAGYIQTEHRKATLAEGLQQILGRPVQVIFEEESATSLTATSSDDGDSDLIASTTTSTPGSPTSSRPTLDLDSARRLPLVHEVLNVFPDAMIIGMFQEQGVEPTSKQDAPDEITEDDETEAEDV